jgi:hypothetical protein
LLRRRLIDNGGLDQCVAARLKELLYRSSMRAHNLRIFHAHRDANACAFHEAFAAIDSYPLPMLQGTSSNLAAKCEFI